MSLIRLTYFSCNRLDRLSGPMDDRVAEILAGSVANNRRDNVTGGLIYDDSWFAQVLEGSEANVSATFERILRDSRHSDVSLVNMQPIGARQFRLWWMAGAARSKDNADLFRHYGENEGFDPRLMRAERLFDLIEAVVGRMTQLQGRKPWTTGSATNAA